MWRLYLTAKTIAQRPSDLLDIVDRWVALQLDNAVIMVGTAIENAAQEQMNVGNEDKPHWKSRYTMVQLLDSAFRLPTNDGDTDIDQIVGISGDFYDEVA